MTFTPKSRQLYQWELEGGHCELSRPDPQLAGFIDYYWLLSVTAPTLELGVIPDTAIDLVLSPDIKDFAALYFPTLEKFDIPIQGPVQYAGICFTLDGASALLGLETSQLKKLAVGSDTMSALGIQALLAEHQQLTSIGACKHQFDQFWLARKRNELPSAEAERGITHHALLELLESSLGESSIRSICDALNISDRQLRRISHDLMGLSPKSIQNILRLQAALAEMLEADAVELRDLYYDDSHRIRELKKLTGFTPKKLRGMAEKYNNH